MLITIITINYNNKEGLRQTIESVVVQSCRDFEYIVIDGGSTDGSLEVIKEHSKEIDFWVSEKDRGIYHAMNKGVTHAHGDYCIFMNSGDCFYDNNVLEILSGHHNFEDVIVGKVSIDKDDDLISPPPPKGELSLYHLYSGAIPHQGSFIRTELLRKYPYDEDLKISSDWKFFIQTLIMDNCSICFMDIFVARYDIHGLSSSNPQLMREEKESVLSELFPPRVLKDYKRMKQSECLTQLLTPRLKKNYCIDKLIYRIGSFLLKIRSK
ncbi:MAG: glycosyltransferase [Prevotella ruminicola]|jgi:hypothetical protein|uniref:Glycosyltransferase n=1 Tax=Xylanibacter ruminicola TaxID=839 RepID=A0A9D5P4W8_XYLRU|nr:glycosyltransferase [Xylanibacter ruminicola]